MFIVSFKLYEVTMGDTSAIHSHNLAPGCGICAQCGLHHRHWTAVVSDSGSCQWPGVHPSRRIYEHVQMIVFGEAFNLHHWKQKNSIRHFIQQRGYTLRIHYTQFPTFIRNGGFESSPSGGSYFPHQPLAPVLEPKDVERPPQGIMSCFRWKFPSQRLQELSSRVVGASKLLEMSPEHP